MACGILVPQPGVEPRPLAVRALIRTTGPSGKSCSFVLCETSLLSQPPTRSVSLLLVVGGLLGFSFFGRNFTVSSDPQAFLSGILVQLSMLS